MEIFCLYVYSKDEDEVKQMHKLGQDFLVYKSVCMSQHCYFNYRMWNPHQTGQALIK